jgi:hypothetical protein
VLTDPFHLSRRPPPAQVYSGAVAWLFALVYMIVSGQDFSTFVYGGAGAERDPQPASIVVFILVASAFFAAANGSIPALSVYEDMTQALAQLFTFGCGTLSVGFVTYMIIANQDFSHLIFGGVRTKAEEREMAAERGEDVPQEQEQEEQEEQEEEEEEEEEDDDDDDDDEGEEEQGDGAGNKKDD